MAGERGRRDPDNVNFHHRRTNEELDIAKVDRKVPSNFQYKLGELLREFNETKAGIRRGRTELDKLERAAQGEDVRGDHDEDLGVEYDEDGMQWKQKHYAALLQAFEVHPLVLQRNDELKRRDDVRHAINIWEKSDPTRRRYIGESVPKNVAALMADQIVDEIADGHRNKDALIDDVVVRRFGENIVQRLAI